MMLQETCFYPHGKDFPISWQSSILLRDAIKLNIYCCMKSYIEYRYTVKHRRIILRLASYETHIAHRKDIYLFYNGWSGK